MAFAEHEVLIPRDALDVYTFLVDRLASTRSYMSGWVNDGLSVSLCPRLR